MSDADIRAFAIRISAISAIVGLLSGITAAAGTWYVAQYRIDDQDARIIVNQSDIRAINDKLEVLGRIDERLKTIQAEIERLRDGH